MAGNLYQLMNRFRRLDTKLNGIKVLGGTHLMGIAGYIEIILKRA